MGIVRKLDVDNGTLKRLESMNEFVANNEAK